MNTPHKYAYVLRALADGQRIQFKAANTKSEWLDFDPDKQSFVCAGLEWQIKPKPTEKAWRWMFEGDVGFIKLTHKHYTDSEVKISLAGRLILGPALPTEIEREVE